MSDILRIAELGNPILRKKAEEVKNISEEEFDLIENMKFTVGKVSGVGLAAPQVFQSKRIFIVASKPSVRYPNAPEMRPQAMINPKIIDMSDEIIKDWEGCLSIPGLRGFIPRSKSITVEYFSENEDRKVQKIDDFIARIFQHEFDHLEGIMFLDRIESNEDLITENEYLKIVSKK